MATQRLPYFVISFVQSIPSLIPKSDDLKGVISDTNSNLIVVTATWLTTCITDSEVFSEPLSTGIVPDDWCTGKTIPIFEKDDNSPPLSYRHISSTSVLLKIMEHIIRSNIARCVDSNDFFNPHQQCFRKNFSCEFQLGAFFRDLWLRHDANVKTDIIFQDSAKAFGKVRTNA